MFRQKLVILIPTRIIFLNYLFVKSKNITIKIRPPYVLYMPIFTATFYVKTRKEEMCVKRIIEKKIT